MMILTVIKVKRVTSNLAIPKVTTSSDSHLSECCLLSHICSPVVQMNVTPSCV